jgi:hypothetical protein
LKTVSLSRQVLADGFAAFGERVLGLVDQNRRYRRSQEANGDAGTH